MSENLQAQACTDEEADAARDAGLFIATTQDERDIHDFAERIRAPLVERIAELERELESCRGDFASAAEACRELDGDLRAAKHVQGELMEALCFAKEKIEELHIENGDGDCVYLIIDDAIDYVQRITDAEKKQEGGDK